MCKRKEEAADRKRIEMVLLKEDTSCTRPDGSPQISCWPEDRKVLHTAPLECTVG